MNSFGITVCSYLAKFLPSVRKICKTKDSYLFIVKVFNFFRYVAQNIRGHCQSHFQNGCTQSPKAMFAFYGTKFSDWCHIGCKLMLTPTSSTLQN